MSEGRVLGGELTGVDRGQITRGLRAVVRNCSFSFLSSQACTEVREICKSHFCLLSRGAEARAVYVTTSVPSDRETQWSHPLPGLAINQLDR